MKAEPPFSIGRPPESRDKSDCVGAAFFDGPESKPEDLECLPFLKAVRGENDVYVRPEQAATVTRIPEGIYRSAASGKPYCFKKNSNRKAPVHKVCGEMRCKSDISAFIYTFMAFQLL